MKTREIFDAIRNQPRKGFSLRMRLMTLVTAELVGCILLAMVLVYGLRDVIPLNQPLLMMLVLLGFCLLIGSAATAILSKYFFDPIKKICKAMEQVADGDFSVRMTDQSSSKEIMEIYSGFNLMVNELGAMEILQTDFVSNVSHEFKTPITAIEGYSTLLQGRDHLDGDERVYVDKILYNTQRLSSLVGSILLLSKLENQQIPTGSSRYRLDEQIRQSIVALEPAWAGKNVEFDADLDSVYYVGNEPMMRHVWDNIIGNAIKFGPEGGCIRIRLTDREGQIRCTIDDSGPGLSEEAQKHLFDKFYQADSSHKQEGNGLGLALVKRILTMENGKITAENLPAGGSRFTVILQHK